MSQNRRIVINSLILYIQLVISTFIGLFTTRIVLLQLGAADFGLYAIVGGLVAMMGIISAAMFATSYRYISIEIGKGSKGSPNKVFNTSLIIHLFLAIFLIIIGETIGIYYIENYLNVLPIKIPEAKFVLHFSLISSAFTVVSVPFQGLLIAKENFIIRAIIDIIRSILNLAFVLLLIYYIGNKLKAYAIIMTIVMVLPSIFLIIYSYHKDREIVSWNLNRKISDYIEMFSFTGWILVGTIAYMGVRQGAAILINLFFGTAINAAFGIASQINNYITIFVKNLNQAAVPQIMKSHSSGDSRRSLSLVYSISKYSFFIMLLPSVPILLSIDSLLILWLKEVPLFTKQFTILMILNGLIGITTSGFDAAVQATGRIRKMHTYYCIILLSSLPISYFLFKINYPPYIITVLYITTSLIYRFVQVNILTQISEFKISKYLNHTIIPTFLVSLVTLPQIFLRNLFGQDISSIIVFSTISIILILTSIYFIGLNTNERNTIKKQIVNLKIAQKISKT